MQYLSPAELKYKEIARKQMMAQQSMDSAIAPFSPGGASAGGAIGKIVQAYLGKRSMTKADAEAAAFAEAEDKKRMDAMSNIWSLGNGDGVQQPTSAPPSDGVQKVAGSLISSQQGNAPKQEFNGPPMRDLPPYQAGPAATPTTGPFAPQAQQGASENPLLKKLQDGGAVSSSPAIDAAPAQAMQQVQAFTQAPANSLTPQQRVVQAMMMSGVPEFQDQGLKMFIEMQSATSKPAEGFTLSPGQARYDASGRVVAEMKDQPVGEPFELGGAWVQRMGDGTIKQVVAPKGAAVNVNMGGQNKFQEASMAEDAKYFADIKRRSQSAQGTLKTIQGLREVFKNLKTGGAAGLQANVASFLRISPSASIEEANAKINNLLTSEMQKLKGLGTLTDADVERLERTLPSVSYSNVGNSAILDEIERAAKNEIDTYRSAAQYVSQNNGLQGWDPSYTGQPAQQNPPALNNNSIPMPNQANPPGNYNMDDLEYTRKKYNLKSVDEVIQRLEASKKK